MSDLSVPSLHFILVHTLLLTLCFSKLKKNLVDFSPSSKFECTRFAFYFSPYFIANIMFL